MRRATANAMAPIAVPPPPPQPSVSHSMLTVNTTGSKRPRTVTAQAEALVLHGHTPLAPSKDQVVVGITAAAGDDVEDWSGDFEAHTPRVHSQSHSNILHDDNSTSEPSETSGMGARLVRAFPRSTSLFHRPTRRSWHRQHSFDTSASDHAVTSDRASRHSHRIRRSSNDAAEESRSSSMGGLSTSMSASGLSLSIENGLGDVRDELIVDDDEHDHDDHERDLKTAVTVHSGDAHKQSIHDVEEEDDEDEGIAENENGAKAEEATEDDDDDDEDWDVEFGFADAGDDDQDDVNLKPGSSSVVDSNRRRADNFNIFLRGFHDMMAEDEFMDDDEELGRSRKGRHVAEESLFKRRRSDVPIGTSIDGTTEAALRSSLSSQPGTTEYSLADKYRLLDVACSSSYAVRIERFPKPCSMYGNLDREGATASLFPMFSDNRLEQWLTNVVRSKCEDLEALMTEEQINTPNPRNQKNHQFRTLVSLPFGKRFVDKCFKQISVYRFYGEDKSNRELIRVFFEKLATAGIADEHWSSKLARADLVAIAGVVMEVLQEAARMYGPIPASGVMTPPPPLSSMSASSRSNGATAFWMRQFQTILTICVEAFPTYRHVIALIELRFVCHHLVGLANSDLSYTWQVCNQYPHFDANGYGEPIGGQSAPIIANEILQHYGALLTALRADVEAASASTESIMADTTTVAPSKFCISTDPHCLYALAVCDVQTVYSSRSALAETTIPELVELFEFEEDDVTSSFHDVDHPFSHESMHEDNDEDDEITIVSLLKPSSTGRRRLLEETLYAAIDLFKEPLVKARCAAVMSSIHTAAATTAISGVSPHAHMKLAESLSYEALRILEWITSRRLEDILPLPETEDSQQREHVFSVFANDGLLSDLGREVLESLGNVLVKNQKYRFGILCLEAATIVYSLLNQGRNHERIDRLMCTLTMQAEDIKRALPLHEKVADSCLRQGNTNEYVFLTQTLTNMWLREGQFSRAEDFLTSAFHYLRDQTSLLPPFFLSSLAGSHNGSDSLSNSSRSGTALTASSSASSSNGSFVYPGGRGNTSEMDLWLNHDITLHLLLRDLYRASGRFIEAMRVLEYLLNYSVRLPRGKRTQLRMLLAEDSLQLRVLDTTRYMFHLLDQEANFFCDRLLQSTLGGVLGGTNNSSSGGFGSSNGGAGGSSSGGRSMGGMGSEARFSFDMVLSIRYILGRAKLYLHLGELRHAYTWLSLAHIKNERESVRNKAKMHMLDGRLLVELLRRQHEQRLLPEKANSAHELHQHRATPVTSVEDTMKAFAASVYALSKQERQRFHDRLTDFSVALESADRCVDLGVQAFWAAYDQYQAIDDRHHQLKALLGVIQCQLVPIERSFFALGSSTSDEQLMKVLGACAVVPRRSTILVTKESDVSMAGGENDQGQEEGEDGNSNTTIEGVRKTLQDCQRLLRQALGLTEQLAEPSSYFQTLVLCSQTWTWLERLSPYKSERPVKEAASFWEEAVKVMKAVYFRRVAFEYDPRNRQSIQQFARSGGVHGRSLGGDSSTFSLVPILNFRESFILRLETVTLQLITTACQLQQFDRVPEYVEDMLMLHMDELLSARMCLNGIAHQLRSFRSQQLHQSIVRQIPLYSIPGPTAYASTTSTAKPGSPEAAVPVNPRASFSSNSLPGVLPSTSSLVNASGTKRKGHKKNQSMSSISELLASSSGAQPTTSSFHDLSLSFVSASGRSTALSGGATPRTGLASLSDRSSKPSGYCASVEASLAGTRSPSATSRSARERSRSAPQSNSPPGRSARSSSNEFLPPVEENGTKRSPAPVRVVELKDVCMWSGSFEGAMNDFTNTNGTSSSTAIGIYDFDDVQSERLWWIFNAWRISKDNYNSGKTEVSAFRHQNLKTLRMLLDAFDPQQVAVLYSGNDKASCGMVGFDVAHINAHTFIEDRGFVLCVGYDGHPTHAHSTISTLETPSRRHHHTRLDFKVFKSMPDKPSTWRLEIPRADWYLAQEHFFDATPSSGDAVLRTLKLLGAKLVLKILGALLLENSLVVVGSSFPLIKEVTFCLLKLLRPFRWQHTFLPFLPIPSWRFLADSLNHHVQAQLTGRSKTKTTLEWRWGSPRNSAPSSTRSASSSSNSHVADASLTILEDEPPFIIGTMAETWHTCVQRLKTSSIDEQSIPAFVNVLNLDDVGSFSSATSSVNAVSFPRKLRKQFLERFDKVVKHRRKIQEKTLARAPPTVASRPSSSFSIKSSFSQHSYHTSSYAKPSKEAAAATADDDRAAYDHECAAAFITNLQDFYDRLTTLSNERAKKLQGKKKHSKRQEIKSWFSSTHDFDAFVDRFLETTMFQRSEADRSSGLSGGAMTDSSVVVTGVLSRSSSTALGPGGGAPRSSKHAPSGGPMTSSTHALVSGASLARSFGSVSSNSSFNGHSSSTHYQL